jgi:hypothetical protein
VLIEDGPILLNQGNYLLGMRRVKARDIQVFGQLSTMQCLIELITKGLVNNIELHNRRFSSLEYNTINIMQAVVVVVSLVRESTIVVKDVLRLLATF